MSLSWSSCSNRSAASLTRSLTRLIRSAARCRVWLAYCSPRSFAWDATSLVLVFNLSLVSRRDSLNPFVSVDGEDWSFIVVHALTNQAGINWGLNSSVGMGREEFETPTSNWGT